MKPFFNRLAGAAAGVALLCAANVAVAGDISGAGATFPYPIYAKWAEAYKAATGIGLNYQSIGSGGGIAQIKAKTVDFGASDKPLSPGELDAAGLTQFPTVIGGVVPVVNVPGISAGQLQLNGKTLAEACLGNIKYWDDPAIKALNPGVNLPHMAIAIVHRSDGSGTNFIFTNYLSKKSPAWASQVGAATSVEWPAGIGAKGNEGIAGNVKQTNGALGYVEYAYAKQNSLTYVRMINHDGVAVAPTAAAFQAASAKTDWAHSASLLCGSDRPARRMTPGRSQAPPSSWSTSSPRMPDGSSRCSASSNGPMPMATIWPPASTMCRCPIPRCRPSPRAGTTISPHRQCPDANWRVPNSV